ncbi:MAG: GBS Bsp-like repeat-containing protein, partial [Lachnospiraceae bacterium]
MGKIKRSLALLLTVLTICTSQGLWVMAEDANTQTSDNPVATEEVTQEKDTVPTEGTSAEGIQENVKEVIPENAKDVFEYVYIDEQVVRTPSAQNIVIAFLDTAVKPEQAILNYHSSITGEKLSLEASGFADNTMLFTKTYDQALEDEYQFDNVIYKQSGQEGETTILFSQEENVTGYKVTAEAAVKEPAEESGVGVTAYTIDEAGNAVEQTGDSTENVVAEVLNQADTNQTAMLSNGASRSRARGAESRAGEFIVAICAGHDSTHTGASGHGLREEQLTLKVAQYCKEELEKYSGVRVYMVRDSEACPNPGTTKGSDNEARINKAVAAGARLYVDIHFNAGGGTGAEIWIPNESYRPNLHQEAEQLANKMLAQLTALGLPNRGAKIKNTTLTGKDGEYPDGSVADYYNTSIMCKEAGIPGIIVEHAFLDNANDAAKLQDETFIKKIGIADATGIAQQYGLTHGSSKPQVSVVNRNEFQGTFRVLVTGVIGASSIQIPTWSAENGQDDDIKWYTAINDGGGTFHVDIKTSDHKNATGLYYAHVYNGPNLLCDTSVTMAKASAIVKTNEIGNNQMQYTTSTQISNSSSELASVTYATWSDKNGQDDVKWSNAVRTGDVWKGTVNISDFKTEGTYQVHAYGKTTEGTEVFLGSSVFKVDAPSVDSLEVQNYNKEKGTFDVVVSGIHSPSGISQIQVPVWCADNQNDIKWYVASRQNDGSYKVSVNVANHKNAVGTYKIHMYATAGNGIAIFKGTEFAVSALTVNVKLSASDSSGNETQYELVAANVGSLGNVSNVSFATWSLQGGQDDIVWYPGIQNNQGAWTTAVNISRHKTAGDYVVHAYATMADGTQRFLGTTSFKIKGITAEKLNVVNYDRDKGTFDVIVSGIHAPSGISQIQIPIWCANDQSDLVWHLASKQRDGNYKVSVNVAQHKYAAGMYKIHMYATSGNGITIFNGMEFPISASSADVAISTFDISGNETNFGLSASNVGRLGNIRAVRFATWSLQGGQDDVVWYSGAQSEQGVWNATANISRHKTAGKYTVHAYATLEDGTERFLGTSSFTVKDIIVKKLEVVNYQKNNGTFEVSISGIEAISGIAQVQIPIWCANDQSDIQWYTALRQADGSYKVNVNIANHKYASG